MADPHEPRSTPTPPPTPPPPPPPPAPPPEAGRARADREGGGDDDPAARCLECGYALTGIARKGRCPECGSVYDLGNPLTYARGSAVAERLLWAPGIALALAAGVVVTAALSPVDGVVLAALVFGVPTAAGCLMGTSGAPRSLVAALIVLMGFGAVAYAGVLEGIAGLWRGGVLLVMFGTPLLVGLGLGVWLRRALAGAAHAASARTD